MVPRKFVSYFRVSTAKQGVSGLGLEAQQDAVRSFCSPEKWILVEEVVEVESGKRNDRPALTRALALCKRNKAVLVIAKLDRLSRNLFFIAGLLESGVEFVAVDNPHANKMTIQLLAVFAEHEREMISARTKAALASCRARGVKLGGDRGKLAQARSVAAQVRQTNAQSRLASLRPIVAAERAAALSEGRSTTLRAIAGKLNGKGLASPAGGRWHPNAVRRIMALQP